MITLRRLASRPWQQQHLISTASRSWGRCSSSSSSSSRSCTSRPVPPTCVRRRPLRAALALPKLHPFTMRCAFLRQPCTRSFSQNAARAAQARDLSEKNKRLGLYAISIVIAVTGISYASVPLYKVFCQATGFGGTTKRVDSLESVVGTAPSDKVRPIKILFNADVSDTTPWKFYPTQPDILVVPGETALAFFTVKNKTDKAVIGVATYNVFPPKAGLYFNKIQCFCFDEQRLKPKEEVDMPVFFFVDPEMLNDPSMENVHEITLSYTFFKTDEDNEEEVQEMLRKNVNYPGAVGGEHGKVRGPPPPPPAAVTAVSV